MAPRHAFTAALLLAAALAAGCAAIGPARMALPAPLAAAPAQTIDGIGSARRGAFSFDGRPVQFERGADRLSLFGVLSADKTMLTLRLGGDAPAALRCDGRALQARLAIVDAPLRPYGLRCQVDGSLPGTIELAERRAVAGTLAGRSGQVRLAGVLLDIHSVHQLQGSAFELAQPAGYLLVHDGAPVAALDLSAGTPRWHEVLAVDDPRRQAARLAGLVLALVWDPAAMR